LQNKFRRRSDHLIVIPNPSAKGGRERDLTQSVAAMSFGDAENRDGWGSRRWYRSEQLGDRITKSAIGSPNQR